MGFSDYGDRWKVHRRIAQNAVGMFVNDRESPIENAIKAEAQFLTKMFLKNGSKAINPHDEVYLSIGNIICALCFGKRYDRNEADFQQLVKMNAEFMAFAGAGNPVDIMPWTRRLTKRSFDQFCGILDTMTKFCVRKTEEHVATYDRDNIRDIVDYLIKTVYEMPDEEKERVGLTDEHILTTVQELIGAGFDTIATTLTWSILFMAKYPEYQKRVQEEIDSVLGKDRLPCWTDAAKLPFTEATILETVRHSCIFPLALPHSTTKDTTLNGYFIPDKTLVFVNLWSITRDDTKFSNPETFDPNRFLVADDSGVVTMDKAASEMFFPYGAGRRRCPGEQLAKIEMFLFFAILMQKCSFEAVDIDRLKVESKFGLTLKPKDFEVFVKPRGKGKRQEKVNLIKG